MGYVSPSRTVGREEFTNLGSRATAPTMYYTRGTEIVSETGSNAIAVRGTLELRGYTFDTIERAGGYVYLRESPTPYLCRMEESTKHNKRHQLRPVHTIHNTAGRVANILIHPGNKPSHFVGCIGVGVKSNGGLSDSLTSMAKVFELLGGFQVGATVWLQVSGEMPEEA